MKWKPTGSRSVDSNTESSNKQALRLAGSFVAPHYCAMMGELLYSCWVSDRASAGPIGIMVVKEDKPSWIHPNLGGEIVLNLTEQLLSGAHRDLSICDKLFNWEKKLNIGTIIDSDCYCCIESKWSCLNITENVVTWNIYLPLSSWHTWTCGYCWSCLNGIHCSTCWDPSCFGGVAGTIQISSRTNFWRRDWVHKCKMRLVFIMM